MNSEDAALPQGDVGEATKEAYHQAWTHIVYDGTDGDDDFTITLNTSGAQPMLELYDGSSATPLLSQWVLENYRAPPSQSRWVVMVPRAVLEGESAESTAAPAGQRRRGR